MFFDSNLHLLLLPFTVLSLLVTAVQIADEDESLFHERCFYEFKLFDFLNKVNLSEFNKPTTILLSPIVYTIATLLFIIQYMMKMYVYTLAWFIWFIISIFSHLIHKDPIKFPPTQFKTKE